MTVLTSSYIITLAILCLFAVAAVVACLFFIKSSVKNLNKIQPQHGPTLPPRRDEIIRKAIRTKVNATKFIRELAKKRNKKGMYY